MRDNIQDMLRSIGGKHIAGLGTGILLVCYTLIILFDLLNVGGARAVYADHHVPLLWNILFQEHGPIEHIQWLFLGLFILSSGYLYTLLRRQGNTGSSRFWLLFAAGGVLMLIEDALNPRHTLIRQRYVHDWILMNTLETAYFGMLATLPVLAVLLYGKYIKEHRRTVTFLALGFLFYGTAAILSGPADITDINRQIGSILYDTTVMIGGDELRTIYEQTDQHLADLAENGFMDIRYRFKDLLVEESLELLGATFLLSSAVSYLRGVQDDGR